MAAVQALAHHVVGRTLDEIIADMRGFYRDLTRDTQLRWLGPEKGILHMATGALVNAVWDLWARREKKPMWKLLADLTPEQIVAAIDFTYITDVLTPEEALELLAQAAAGPGGARGRDAPRRLIPPTPPPRAGSAIPTRRCAGSAARRWPRAGRPSR